ncbi:Sorting nexin-18 [Pitangus sulphuratus]|nr:Sorting nexin-18 [Pitangus sulphuratus]
MKELEDSKKVSYPNKKRDIKFALLSNDEEVTLQPLMKTETTDDGQGQQTATKTVLYTVTEISTFQEKYNRLSRESETEYVWTVSLMGGDQIMLSEAEAQGFWGPVVFLMPNQGSDDDWDDDWDESSTVAYEPGALSSSYPVYEATSRRVSVHYHLSMQSELSLSSCSGHLAGHQYLPSSGTKSSAMVSCNLNRFSTFVKSGGEAFVLGEVSGFVKDGDKLCLVLGPRGPEWQENPYPFQCSIEDPTKQTKFKGMKSYIAYKLVSSHTEQQVHRRYKHFDWLYGRLAEKFPVISVPHLPEKQTTGRFEEDFISKRRKDLAWWMDRMCSHPVLAQCDAFQHFLTCPSTDEKTWKQGKRRAEKDEMVGAKFFLTISVPTGSGAGLDLHEVESQLDGFKAFTKKMDESALQLNHTANEFARKQITSFKKEYRKVGHSFKCLSQAFELDQQAFSAGLNQAIAFTAEAYDTIGDLFADQLRQDLDAVIDLLVLYQGHLANFPDIIHVQKGNTPTCFLK